MMEESNIIQPAMSDNAIVKLIGSFIKHHRLNQNKTQSQLANDAGINRSTLFEFEQGRGGNLIILIQLLRALNQLHTLKQFEVHLELSTIQLATLAQAKRKRASGIKKTNRNPKSDW